MSSATLLVEMKTLIKELWRHSLIVDATDPIIIQNPGNVRLITWATWRSHTAPFYVSARLDEYSYHAENRNYSILLFDQSIVQISYGIRKGDVVFHRLYFCPCPIQYTEDELQHYGSISEMIRNLDADDLRERLRLESSIRFDFDPNAASSFHPAAHLTVLRPTCRVPVFAPLSIGHFIRFVFLHFYREQWEAHQFIREWPYKNWPRTIQRNDRKHLHFECAV